MQDISTYKSWLDAVCHICNNLLKANISIVGDEFKVVVSKYRWITHISCDRIKYVYDKGWEPCFGATRLINYIVEQWDMLLVEFEVY